MRMMVDKQIYIVFRMDDYSAVSDTGLELNIIELFQEKKIGVTFGVVPYVCAGSERDPSPQELIALSPEKVNILGTKMSSGFLDVALHGYSHQTNGSNEPSEFVGLDYATQVKRLSRGKRLLEEMSGKPVQSFVPPWNQYDHNTLRALEALEFTTLSAGWKGVVNKESKICFVPATCSLKNLRDAIKAARTSSDQQPLIVALFHHYDFTESKDKRGNMSLQSLSDLLDWLALQKDLRFISISQANKVIADLSAQRFLMVERWRSVERFLPSKLREKKPVLLYHEASVLLNTRFKLGIYYGLIALLFAISALSIGLWLFPLSAFLAKVLMYGSILLTVGVIVSAFKNQEVSPKGLIASLSAVGFCIGIASVYLLLN